MDLWLGLTDLSHVVLRCDTMGYMSKIQRSIRLSPEADEVLRVLAIRQDRSVSQLIEMAVRSNWMSIPGGRSDDGRESARTKAAREHGAHWPTGDTAKAVMLERQKKLNQGKGPA